MSATSGKATAGRRRTYSGVKTTNHENPAPCRRDGGGGGGGERWWCEVVEVVVLAVVVAAAGRHHLQPDGEQHLEGSEQREEHERRPRHLLAARAQPVLLARRHVFVVAFGGHRRDDAAEAQERHDEPERDEDDRPVPVHHGVDAEEDEGGEEDGDDEDGAEDRAAHAALRHRREHPRGHAHRLDHLQPLVAVHVVHLALLGVGERGVRRVDRLHLDLRLLLAPVVPVRVVLERELAVRLLDLVGRRRLRDAERLVVRRAGDERPHPRRHAAAALLALRRRRPGVAHAVEQRYARRVVRGRRLGPRRGRPGWRDGGRSGRRRRCRFRLMVGGRWLGDAL